MPGRTAVLIVAGEPSGDLHAATLVKELTCSRRNLEFFGMGGSLMREAGVATVTDVTELALVGVVEVVKKIFVVRAAYRALLEAVTARNPSLAILVDYPGFNLRLARELKRRGIPVIYYISPQVWAWGAGRIATIKACVKKIVVFFPFEEALYKQHGVDVAFVGHPLVDSVRPDAAADVTARRHGLDGMRPIIALLPGSRATEVKLLLPIMLAAARRIVATIPGIQIAVSKFKGLPQSLYDDALRGAGTAVTMVEGDTHNLLAAARFAIVASGTATLETTIIGTPFVLIYKVHPLSYPITQLFMRTKFLGLANIIAGREIVPEFLQYDATAEKIAGKVVELMQDDGKRTAMVADLGAVTASLGKPGAARRAAEAILPLLP